MESQPSPGNIATDLGCSGHDLETHQKSIAFAADACKIGTRTRQNLAQKGITMTLKQSIPRIITGAVMVLALVALAAPRASAQGSRKDDVAFGANGRPLAGATITVCTSGATGSPCSPLATLYTDATLTVPSPNPFQADGLGNYHFYALPGRYVLQISGSGMNSYTIKDAILPNDPSTPSFSSVTATSIALGGNLTVGGNATVTGTLSAGVFNPSTISTGALNVSGNESHAGPRPWIDVTAPPYNAQGNGGTDDTAAVQAAINSACTSSTGGGTVFFPPASGGNPIYNLTLPTPLTISSIALASNVVTVTISGGILPSAYTTNFPVIISGVTNDLFNGTWIISSVVSSTQFKFSLTAANTSSSGGQVNLPPVYIPPGCIGLTFQGGGSYAGNTPQFSRPPLTRVGVGSSSTNLAPVFLVANTGTAASVTFRDVAIQGNNQAVQVFSTTSPAFFNVEMSAANKSGPLVDTVDNTPLAMYNTFWFWYENGALNTNGSAANQPAMVLAFVGSAGQPGGGLGVVRNIISTSYFLVDNRTSTAVSAGTLDFENDQQENNGNPFFTVTNSGGHSFTLFSNLIFKQDFEFDCISNSPFIVLNAPAEFNSIHLEQVGGCVGSNLFNAIQVVQGTLDSVFLEAAGTVVDGSGNPLGNVEIHHNHGVEFITRNQPAALETQIGNGNSTCAGCFGGVHGPPVSFTQSGNTQRNMAMNPYAGLLWGDGTHPGFESAINRNASNSVAINLAQAIAPTGLTATPTTGGTLASGTYFYSIETGSASTSNISAASSEVSVTLTGSNNAVNLTWNTPGGTNPGACFIFRSTIPGGTYQGGTPFYQINACPTHLSFTDTNGTPSGAGGALFTNQTLAPFYTFASNTANPNGGSVPYYSGSPTSGNCAKWGSSGLLQDAGATCGSGGGGSLTAFAPSPNGAGQNTGPSSANAINVVAFLVPMQVQFGHISIDVATPDTTAGSLCGSFADCYDVGIYNMSGTRLCDWGATALSSGGIVSAACVQGTVTLTPGYYIFAFTGNGTTAKIFFGTAGGGGFVQLASATSGTSSTGGALPSTISLPAFGQPSSVGTTYANVFIALY